jgi:hypothetical protein
MTRRMKVVEARVKAVLVKRDGLIAQLCGELEAERPRADTAARLMVEQR